MTKAKRLLFLLLIGSCTQPIQAQTGSVDSMIQKLFFALKTKDTSAYLHLFANGQQMDQLYGMALERLSPQERIQIKKAIEKSDPTKKVNADSVFERLLHQFSAPGVMEKRKKEAVQTFQHIIEEGKKKQVDWSVARLISYHLDTAGVSDYQRVQTGVKNLTGVINFSSDDSLYHVSFYNLIYLPLEKSWFEGQFREVIREREQFTPDIIETREITLTDIQEDEPPPPPPPLKKKLKAKGKVTKPKKKSTS